MPGNPPFWLKHSISVPYLVTSPFGVPRPYGPHEGLDLNAKDSTGHLADVFAAQRGVVELAKEWNPVTEGYGKYVKIRHDWPDGTVFFTWYGHMSEYSVKAGDFVAVGQKIGVAGSTGNSTGVHLHLTLQHIGHGLSGFWLPDILDPTPLIRMGPPPEGPEAMFVADVTVPAGMILQPGTSFIKTWKIVNSGTVPWGAGFELAFFDLEQMEGPDSLPLPIAALGEQVSVSVSLKAPTGGGRHKGLWKPRDTAGKFFDFPLAVEIVVSGTGVTDDAKYLTDVTIPDNTVVQPGQTFLKKWKVRNTGTTTWGTGYQLAHYDHEQMGAPASVPIPRAVPGEEVDVAVTHTAPSTPGSHRSTWRLRNAQGQDFGEIIFALIKVEAVGPVALDQLMYVNDVTFPDDSKVKTGQSVEKIWRVRNSGQTTWDAGYQLAFVSGEQMGAAASVALPAAAPGQVADVSVMFTAPILLGAHQSTWEPRNSQGIAFEGELHTQFEVVSQTSAGDEVDDALFVADITVLDGSTKQAGEIFLKTWRLRNIGTTSWDGGHVLAYFSDDQMTTLGSVSVPAADPGEEVDVSVRLTAPLVPGLYKSTWIMRNPQGEFFGNELYTIIRVPSAQPPTPDNRAVFEKHDTIPNGTKLLPNQKFGKIWTVRNVGASTWGPGYTLAFAGGITLNAPESVAVPATFSQQTARLKVNMKTPSTQGVYKGYWRLRDPAGKFFGPRLQVWIEVRKP